MSEQTIKIPRLTYNLDSIQFVIDLWFLNLTDKYIFDFGEVGKIEPFTLLFLSSELKRFRDSRPEGNFLAINVSKLKEAADMGFFKAIGIEYGEIKLDWQKTLTSIPIKIFNTREIIKNANDLEKPVGDYLNDKAISMSNILTQSSKGDLFDAISYSIREILRNVIEHSETEQFGFCAKHWPNLNKVSLAIIDRGVGLKSSLSANPFLKITSDLDAINYAIQPGISGKAFKGSRIDDGNIWANSGYGLYMTSSLCKLGGSFVLASGSNGIFLSGKKIVPFNIQFRGTILNLSLNTTKLDSLNDMLAKLRNSIEVKNAPLNPSTASMGL